MEVGIRPLCAENRDNDPLGKLKIEPAKHYAQENDTSERPWCCAEGTTRKMNDGSQALAPMPAAGKRRPGFRNDVQEFFSKITQDRFCLLGGAEQRDKPRGDTRWPRVRSRMSHERLQTRSRPSVKLRRARCVRLTADTPCAVTRKNRLDLPPRSGVGSPGRDCT